MLAPMMLAKPLVALLAVMRLPYHRMTASVKSASSFVMTDRVAALRLQPMATELAQRVGERIRARREELGLSQRQVADRMPDAVSNQHVSNWERAVNQPSPRYLPKLAEALEVDIGYFHIAPASAPAIETPDPFDATPKWASRLEGKVDRLLVLLDGLGERPVPRQLSEMEERLGERVSAAVLEAGERARSGQAA